MKHSPETTTQDWAFPRLAPDPQQGLSSEEASLRVAYGAHNESPQGITPSVGRIIFQNTFTLFNLINFVLALSVLLVGHPKNALFFGIAICNTAMGIFQELRAKRTLDKLSVLSKGMASVVRDGNAIQIEQDAVVLDDILILRAGDQVCADGVVAAAGGLEVDESLLTGEADKIAKAEGDSVLSGSFATAGWAYVRVTAVGRQSYANVLTAEAKREKKPVTPLLRTLNQIIRVLSIVIIPLGILLFYTQYSTSDSLPSAVLSATAAMIGMIPEGLVLLTGVTLSVGAIKLAQKKALVQSLYNIETLARADVLCLDKTGTITNGTLSYESLLPMDGYSHDEAGGILREMMAALQDENGTAKALRSAFGGAAAWAASGQVPFSSDRKWSGVQFTEQGSYVLGAPGFVFPGGKDPFFETVTDYASKGFRVLCLAHSEKPFDGDTLPSGLSCVALVVLSDTIRPEAPDTFRFFADEGVTLKVISGDDALTVSTIAAKAGIAGADNFIDMSTLSDDADLGFVAEHYTVFGRVTPAQKRELIRALKNAGHTCCMTGDGVNDVLAMKEASCSVAMIGGSDAARSAADIVLMTSNFAAMVDVLREGRRVINNIENVASLYLVKTIYSTILSLLYIFIPYPYPFAPLQMTPINSLMVGFPSFFLALRGNYQKPEGKFLAGILENSVPAALCVVFNILVVQLAGVCFGLSQAETSTMNVLLTGVVCYVLLFKVSQPLRWQEILLLCLIAVGFLGCFFLLGEFFMLGSLFTRNAFFYLPLAYISYRMFPFLASVVRKVEAME